MCDNKGFFFLAKVNILHMKKYSQVFYVFLIRIILQLYYSFNLTFVVFAIIPVSYLIIVFSKLIAEIWECRGISKKKKKKSQLCRKHEQSDITDSF